MEEEEVVEFWLYPGPSHAVSPAATLASVYSVVAPLARRWVWHRQAFSLAVVEEGDSWHLAGALDYGENVLDEWFVVSLLLRVTEEVPGLVARVTDGDGELLLIEAAAVLPAWAAEPAVAEGRAFLQGGQLHLLPVCSSPATVSPLPCGTPAPAAAAAVVASYPALTLASGRVQAAIQARLAGLPHTTEANHHRANAVLPAGLAAMLGRDPELLGRLVAALRGRDAAELRATRKMEKVQQEGMVRRRVTFSKCLYAMLAGVEARPTRGSGWEVGEDREALLGYKLAAGLEVLLSRAGIGGRDRQSQGQGFAKFVAKLEELGFFQGELEGSKRHRQLLEDCRGFWAASQTPGEGRDLAVELRAAAEAELEDSFLVGPPGEEDAEDWLDMTPESLDALLEAQFGAAAGGADIQGELGKFLGKVSDMAGVENEEDALLDHENMMEMMKKMMVEMGELEPEALEDGSGEEEGDEEGDEDHLMTDYLGRLDTEVQGEAADRDVEGEDAVMENLLKSYSAQAGLGGHGPLSSILQSLKLNPGPPRGPLT